MRADVNGTAMNSFVLTLDFLVVSYFVGGNTGLCKGLIRVVPGAYQGFCVSTGSRFAKTTLHLSNVPENICIFKINFVTLH